MNATWVFDILWSRRFFLSRRSIHSDSAIRSLDKIINVAESIVLNCCTGEK